MTVDLSCFVGKNCEVTFRNGDTKTGIIKRFDNSLTYEFKFCGKTYTEDGSYLSGFTKSEDIISIRLIGATKYQDLERQVAEMQAEIERLKNEEEKAKKAKLPALFNRKHALAVLDGNFTSRNVDGLCVWSSTPQGYSYWHIINRNHRKTLPDEALSYLKDMVILSYRNLYGD